MKKITIYAICMLFLFSACGDKKKEVQLPGKEDVILVKVTELSRDTIYTSFSATGRFTTESEVPRAFKNGGIIDHIYVKEGDRVRKGQVLAEVNSTEVSTMYQQAITAYEKAVRDYNRASNLYRDSVATLEQMQNAKTAVEVAEQQKKKVEFNLEHSQLKALHDGVILEKYFKEGQLVGPGMPVLLYNNTTNQNWIFKLHLSDQQWASLNIGDSARIRSDVSERELKAVVSYKSSSIDPNSGGFIVKLKVQNIRNYPLASGLFGYADLYSSQAVSGWKIPYHALLDGDEDSGYVFITQDKKTVKKVPVKIRRVMHGEVLIDASFPARTYLITTGSTYLKESSQIQVIE